MTNEDKFQNVYDSIKLLSDANIETVGKNTGFVLCLQEYFNKTRKDKLVADVTGIVGGGLAVTAALFPGLGPTGALHAAAFAAGVHSVHKNLKTAEEEKAKLIEVQEDITALLRKHNVGILKLARSLAALGIDLDQDEGGPVQQILGTHSRKLVVGTNTGGATVALLELMTRMWNPATQDEIQGEAANEDSLNSNLRNLLEDTNADPSQTISTAIAQVESYFGGEIAKKVGLIVGVGLLFVNIYQLAFDWDSDLSRPITRRLRCLTRELQWEFDQLNLIKRHVNQMEIAYKQSEIAAADCEIERLREDMEARTSFSLRMTNASGRGN